MGAFPYITNFRLLSSSGHLSVLSSLKTRDCSLALLPRKHIRVLPALKAHVPTNPGLLCTVSPKSLPLKTNG